MELQYTELGLDCLVHSLEKSVLLPFFSVGVVGGITGEIVELGEVLADRLVTLGECQEFLLLHLYETGGYVCLAEGFLKLCPGCWGSISSGSLLVVPPNIGRAFKIVGGEEYFVQLVNASKL